MKTKKVSLVSSQRAKNKIKKCLKKALFELQRYN